MTAFEWVCYIAFNIAINVVLQLLAWKIGFLLGEGQKRSTEKERDQEQNEEVRHG